MKKSLLLLTFIFFSLSNLFAQVQSITPNNGLQNQMLPTTITMVTGTYMFASPPMNNTDLYLQQGGTTIYADPGFSMNWWNDQVYPTFTIPPSAPNGYYDVIVVTYDMFWTPTTWTLTDGFFIGQWAGTVEGDIYLDTNQNGLRDVGEVGRMNHRVSIAPYNYTLFANTAGHYKAYLDSGSYTISYNPSISYFQTSTPATYSGSIPPSASGYDFGVYTLQSYYNQLLYLYKSTQRCSPWTGNTFIRATNNGNIPVQGSITLTHSPSVTYISSPVPPDVINGNTLTWYYSNLGVGQTYSIGGVGNYIYFTNPPAGQLVWYSVIDSVYDMSGNVMTQYTDSFATITVCSYDPNDKHAYPGGVGAQNYIPMDSPMEFLINFQNTGTDTAFNIVITDTLDPDLDWNTFEIIGYSHDVYTQIDPNGVVTFTFENIHLPDSNVDEPGSHGFVTYRLNVDSFLPDPTEITNTAYIYFDYNAAIVTNTTLTTLSDLALPVASFTANDLTVCPGSCISFTDQSAFALTYEWTFTGGNPSTSTDQNPANICYSTGGDYDVQLIVTNALGSDTLVYTNYIHVYNVPVLSITQSGDTLFAVQGFTTYVWYHNGNIISGATDYFHVATQNGDYNVIAFDANGCDVEAALFNVMTAVSGLDMGQLQLYPNPVRDVLNVSGVRKGELRIMNVLGDVVYSIRLDSGEALHRVDISSLNPGTYAVEIITDGQLYHRQIVKQ